MSIAAFVLSLIASLFTLFQGGCTLGCAGIMAHDTSVGHEAGVVGLLSLLSIAAAVLGFVGGGFALMRKPKAKILLGISAGVSVLSLGMLNFIWGIFYGVAAFLAHLDTKGTLVPNETGPQQISANTGNTPLARLRETLSLNKVPSLNIVAYIIVLFVEFFFWILLLPDLGRLLTSSPFAFIPLLGQLLALLWLAFDLKKKEYALYCLVVAVIMNFFTGFGVGRSWYSSLFFTSGSFEAVAAILAYLGRKGKTPATSIPFLHSINTSINTTVQAKEKAPDTTQKIGRTHEPIIGVETEALIKRAFIFMEDDNFDEAERYLEQALNQDPESSKAYLGKLMVEKKVHTVDELVGSSTPFDDNKFFKRALRFANEEEKSQLEGYVQANRAKFEQQDTGTTVSANDGIKENGNEHE